MQAALLRRVPPVHPATAPSRKFPVFWPKILLLVRVPPLVHGLKIVLVKYDVAKPAATPANPASTAPLPVKNLMEKYENQILSIQNIQNTWYWCRLSCYCFPCDCCWTSEARGLAPVTQLK